jgi:RNA polymerase sigma factor (sigma-70 family)
MANSSLHGALRDLRKLVRGPAEEPSDAALLERFVMQRDEAAFTLLVERYGPLVLGICRQVLGDDHAAEDAFQATFLILARKAAAIRQRGSLAAWLHHVAANLARTARTSAARRRKHERQAMLVPSFETPAAAADREWQPVVHEEVDRLPQKYRVPVVLCYLHGKSHEAAARELGWPIGTVKGRLTRARDLLHRRLKQRGVSLSLGAFAASLARPVRAEVPKAWVGTTVQAAIRFVDGPALGGAVSAGASTLAEGMLKGLAFGKWKLAALVLLTVGTLALGAAGYLHPSADAAPGAQAAGKSPEATIDQPARVDLFGDPLPPGALARMGTVRWRHGEQVNCVGFLAGGKELLSAGRDGLVKVWDAATGRERRRFGTSAREHSDIVQSAALSANREFLATARRDGTIQLWHTATGQARGRLQVAKNSMAHLAFLPDGKTLLSVTGNGLAQWWDVATGKETRQIDLLRDKLPKGAADMMAVSLDGTLLALGSCDNTNKPPRTDTVRLYEIDSGKELRAIRRPAEYQQRLIGLAFAPDGKAMAWAGNDDTLVLYDAASGAELRTFGTARTSAASWYANVVGFSPDGKVLFARSQGRIQLWDPATGEKLVQLGQPEVERFAFAPDNRTLAVACLQTIRLWDARTGKEIGPLATSEGGPWSPRLSPDGRVLTTVSWGVNAVVRRWEVTTGKELPEPFPLPHQADQFMLLLSPDGQIVAMPTVRAFSQPKSRTTVTLWQTSTRKQLCQLDVSGDGWVSGSGAAFSLDSKILAIPKGGHDRELELWETATGKSLGQISAAGRMSNPIFCPDGATVAAIVSDTSVRNATVYRLHFWSTTTRQAVRALVLPSPAFRTLAFAPDGRVLAVETGKDAFSLIDAATGKERRRFTGVSVSSVAFSPDGRLLAGAAESDRSVRLWEIRTAKEIGRFQGHQGSLSTVVFTPDGEKLISGNWDTTALVWDVWSCGAERRSAPASLSPQQLDSLWTELADEDPARAFRAMGVLCRTSHPVVPWLGERVRPERKSEAPLIAGWIADLDSTEFAVRQKATTELEKRGELARPQIEKALAGRPSLDSRRRLERLVEQMAPDPVPPADILRALRAVEVLEHIGTPEAKRLLDRLAGGAAGARLTLEAQAAGQRLARR